MKKARMKVYGKVKNPLLSNGITTYVAFLGVIILAKGTKFGAKMVYTFSGDVGGCNNIPFCYLFTVTYCATISTEKEN